MNTAASARVRVGIGRFARSVAGLACAAWLGSGCDESAGEPSESSSHSLASGTGPDSASHLSSGGSLSSGAESTSATSNDASASDEENVRWVDMITADAWVVADPASDPFPDHRPHEAGCPDGTWRRENNTLEIDTGYCAYALFTQPSAMAVQAGQSLHVVAWHLQLTAPNPGIGHMALQLGDEVIWQTQTEIPAAAQAYDVQVQVQRDHPVGSPIVLHLHNHGFNNWSFFQLQQAAK